MRSSTDSLGHKTIILEYSDGFHDLLREELKKKKNYLYHPKIKRVLQENGFTYDLKRSYVQAATTGDKEDWIFIEVKR